jgi:ApeA N-terminal domain 1
VLRRVHLERADQAVFTSVRVRIENLSVWSALTTYSRKEQCPDPAAHVPIHPAVEFDHAGLAHHFGHLVAENFDFELTRGGVDVVCPTSVVLEISAKEPVALAAFDSAIFSWVDLLTFVTGEACGLISVRLVHKDPLIYRRLIPVIRDDGSKTMSHEDYETERVIDMRARWSSTPKVGADTEINPLGFTISSGERSLEDWYRHWMSFRGRAKRGLHMLLSLTYGSNAFLQSDLLVVALGAETMHRGLFPDCLAMLPKDFDPIIETAVQGLEAGDAERIRRAIRNEPSYPDRLRDLAALPHQQAVQIAVPDIAQWSKDLAAVRNGLAHGLRKSITDLQLMYDLTKRMRVLLELVAMAELGVSDEVQENHAIEHQV